MNLPRPEPSAGILAYAAEREECLRDERKFANYRKYLMSSKRVAEVDYLPIKLDIENTSRCNFACTMCAVSKWKHGKRAEDMSLECFKRLIDEQYGLVEIKLNGLGEALMQGDDYFEMIKYARSKRIWVRMTTNASLLHLRDNYKKLIDSGVNEIDISIDGADKQTFEGIRIQSDFDRVVSNCKLLNEYAVSQGKPWTKMWTLVQKDNYENLQDHVYLARTLGFRRLVFSLDLHGWADKELEDRNRRVTIELSDVRLRGLMELGKELDIKVSFWNVNAKFQTDRPEHLCPWPFERAVVTSDSRTVPCCMIGTPDSYEIGRGNSFIVNWLGGEYREFRRAHLTGNIPDICKGCYKQKEHTVQALLENRTWQDV